MILHRKWGLPILLSPFSGFVLATVLATLFAFSGEGGVHTAWAASEEIPECMRSMDRPLNPEETKWKGLIREAIYEERPSSPFHIALPASVLGPLSFETLAQVLPYPETHHYYLFVLKAISQDPSPRIRSLMEELDLSPQDLQVFVQVAEKLDRILRAAHPAEVADRLRLSSIDILVEGEEGRIYPFSQKIHLDSDHTYVALLPLEGPTTEIYPYYPAGSMVSRQRAGTRVDSDKIFLFAGGCDNPGTNKQGLFHRSPPEKTKRKLLQIRWILKHAPERESWLRKLLGFLP